MLAYDDPRWLELRGGSGVAYNPCPALRQLESGTRVKEAWDELWNELHHQGDLGLAAYAAVPHLIRIQKQTQRLDWNVYALTAAIEVERHRKTNPEIPPWLAGAYFNAWKEALECGLADLRGASDELTVRSILAVLALCKGLLKFGALISSFDESEINDIVEEHMAWSELYR